MYYEVTYELIITKTSKAGKSGWQTYDQTRKEFKTRQEVAQYLGNEYHYAKTTIPTYHDNHQGQAGRIYAWKDKENGKTFYCQDWVSVYESERIPVMVSRSRS